MTHDAIVTEIMARAGRRGVLTHYCGSSVRCTGETGKPDLVLAGLCGVVWIEVKRPGDRMRPGQTTWRYTLIAAGEVYEVMAEADLVPGGAVDMVIDFAASGSVRAA